MECAEYRRSILADPHDASPELRAHLTDCHDCGEFTEKLLRFESRLDRALRIDVPPRGREPARRNHRLLAIAASVLVAAAVAGGLWLAAPGPTLAADVINHMAEEPFAWKPTDVPVPQPTLDEVLSESHLRLKSNAGLVSYANSCLFRGHAVPHLVVQTGAGPVTVMILTHEPLGKALRFDEQGYRGMLLPVNAHGSLAVLERGQSSDSKALDEVAARVLAAIEWTN
jgi:hypothetical protein